MEAAGRTLIGKATTILFFFGDHGPRTNVISKVKGFRLVFHFNFEPLRLIFLKSLPSAISNGRKRSSLQFMVEVQVSGSAGGPE